MPPTMICIIDRRGLSLSPFWQVPQARAVAHQWVHDSDPAARAAPAYGQQAWPASDAAPHAGCGGAPRGLADVLAAR